ncbi:MAG: hypothetical protein HY800_07630 [Ignavibacteriales bacterium]|nr:hypothetical protein [Ignavibacteriales bacterium]
MGKREKFVNQVASFIEGNLDRWFHEIQGEPMGQFIRRKLTEKIIEEILTSNKYGYQIAKQFDFPNSDSFYHWIDRHFGKSFEELKKNLDVLHTPLSNKHSLDVRKLQASFLKK